ncbi:protease modulator HflC [Legionella saoudiensis]|uniref:protease modulator HflC n=1 Tax=Legionella saoudiensis TaxID=1750561 RepID=UPI00072FE13A|nr:protease modulator HflC [Legionella saoudiensis]
MKNSTKALGVLVFIALLLFFACVFTITEGQQGIILRLGRLVNERDTDKVKVFAPGLHFKVPFIESVRIFDTRIQTMDIKSTRIVTKEKKDVMVDYYVKWQITDLARYFKSTGGNEFKAETLLEQQLNTLLRAQFGKRTISEVVSGGRDDVMGLLRVAAEKQAGELGINVVDVRIKGIELPANTSNAIYQRMRADMQKIANRHRADGQAAAEEIQAKADADVMVLIARTESEAQKVRAIGQAKAASIYAEAYSKNKDFFTLYRSLLAYEGSFNSKKDILVLDQSSAFFNYFRQPIPNNDGINAKK